MIASTTWPEAFASVAIVIAVAVFNAFVVWVVLRSCDE